MPAMTRWATLPTVVLADRTVVVTVLIAGIVTVLAATLRFPTIGTPFGNEIVPWPLLPCVPPVLLAGGAAGSSPILERASSRGPLAPTSMRLVVLVGACFVAAAMVTASAPDTAIGAGGVAAFRNAALISGLALAGALVLPETLAWAPASGYLLVSAVVGVPPGGPAPWWSLLVQPAEQTAAAAIGFGVLAVAVALTLERAGRGRRLLTRAAPPYPSVRPSRPTFPPMTKDH